MAEHVELLPCPFCGGDELSSGWSAPGVDGSATTGEVQCHSCDALLWKSTEAESITAWNTHQSPAIGEADVERVVLALDRFSKLMAAACDRTQARKGGVLVETRDWHALMSLGENARAAIRSLAKPGEGRE